MSFTPSGLHRALMRDAWSTQADWFFGEMLLIQPMRRPQGPNSQSEPDATRKAFEIAGVFRAPREPLQVNQSDTGRLNIALDRPSVSIALAALPIALRIGDCIVRLQRGEYYEIKSMKADALRIRGEFELFQLGNQPGLGGAFYDQS